MIFSHYLFLSLLLIFFNLLNDILHTYMYSVPLILCVGRYILFILYLPVSFDSACASFPVIFLWLSISASTPSQAFLSDISIAIYESCIFTYPNIETVICVRIFLHYLLLIYFDILSIPVTFTIRLRYLISIAYNLLYNFFGVYLGLMYFYITT